MASGGFSREQVRYLARYKCTECNETWKVRNSSGLAKECQSRRRCSNMVSPYQLEAINVCVTYKCPECKVTKKMKKCKSEINDVPYCSIHGCDMVVVSHFVIRTRKPRRMFGIFQCEHPCTNRWSSGYSWEGKGQDCRACNKRIMPYNMKPLEWRGENNSTIPHDQARCEMCQFLGNNCKDYKAPVDDNMYDDYEEDDENVVSINSDVISGSGSSSSGTATPTEGYDDSLDFSIGKLNQLKLN